MPVKFEVTTKVGQDKTGKDVTRKIGVIVSTKNGGFMLKLESVPIGWDGWAWLNEPRQAPQQSSQQRQAPQGGGGGQFDDMEDDVPFLFNMNTVSDILGAPRSLMRANRAKDGEKMLLLQANKTDC